AESLADWPDAVNAKGLGPGTIDALLNASPLGLPKQLLEESLGIQVIPNQYGAAQVLYVDGAMLVGQFRGAGETQWAVWTPEDFDDEAGPTWNNVRAIPGTYLGGTNPKGVNLYFFKDGSIFGEPSDGPAATK